MVGGGSKQQTMKAGAKQQRDTRRFFGTALHTAQKEKKPKPLVNNIFTAFVSMNVDFYGRSEVIRTPEGPPPSHGRNTRKADPCFCFSLLWAVSAAQKQLAGLFLLAYPWSRIGSGRKRSGDLMELLSANCKTKRNGKSVPFVLVGVR